MHPAPTTNPRRRSGHPCRNVLSTLAAHTFIFARTCFAFTNPSDRVALVTGANKGIGKEIARRIALKPECAAVIASRDLDRAEDAAADLRSSGCSDVSVCRLDLTDLPSIESAADFIRNQYGKLDVLVNNAAVCFNDPTLYGRVRHTPFEQQAGITVETNFFGTLAVTDAFLPLLRESASPRIVNVASAAGRLSIFPSEERIRQITSETLTVSKLKFLMNEFVSDAQNGVHLERGWPNTAYGVSKAGVIALTRILARENPNVTVNSVDPGFCRTDQNDNQGYVDPARGALTPFLLATLPDKDLASGRHFFEEREISWWYQ